MAEAQGLSIDDGLIIPSEEIQRRIEAGQGVRNGDGLVPADTLAHITALQGDVNAIALDKAVSVKTIGDADILNWDYPVEIAKGRGKPKAYTSPNGDVLRSEDSYTRMQEVLETFAAGLVDVLSRNQDFMRSGKIALGLSLEDLRVFGLVLHSDNTRLFQWLTGGWSFLERSLKAAFRGKIKDRVDNTSFNCCIELNEVEGEIVGITLELV